MTPWRPISIQDLVKAGKANIQTGPFGTQLAAKHYVEEGTPVVNVRNIGYGGLRNAKLEFVSEETARRLSMHSLKEGDIVFGRKGAVDRHLLVSHDEKHWLQGSDCIRLRFLDQSVVPRFVSFALRLPAHKEWILSQAGNKATMASLNQDIIGRIKVRLPDPPEQERIAGALGHYDELISNNSRRIALLEEAARQIYKEWFVRLRYPGYERVKVVKGVPEGWERKRLGEVCDLEMGQSPESKHYNESGEGLPFFQGVADFGERFPEPRVYSTVGNRYCDPGDVLLSVRAPVGRLNIALDRAIIGRGLAALKPRAVPRAFFFQMLRQKFFQEDIIGTGAIFASVTKSELASQELAIPTETVATNFEERVSPIDNQIRTLYLQNKKLTEARDLLLPRLMSGDVKPSNLKGD